MPIFVYNTSMSQKKYSVIIHGGCISFEDGNEMEEKYQASQREALQEIVAIAWEMVERGDKAMDVVEKTINRLEDSPYFNAGIGAAICKDKSVELDASIMNGDDLACGAVAGMVGYKNPISVARKVMTETPHTFFISKGAMEFAKTQGFPTIPVEEFHTEYQLEWNRLLGDTYYGVRNKPAKGTVGVIVADKNGSISAGTSTGGLANKMSGRVGDTPMIGSGTYADTRYGGASTTGNGEQIMKVNMTKLAVDFVRFEGLNAQQATKKAISELGELKNGLGGIIMIDKNGDVGAYTNERFLTRAYMTSDMDNPIVAFEI